MRFWYFWSGYWWAPICASQTQRVGLVGMSDDGHGWTPS
ncbi:hypothetical protein CTAM01_17181 [Colletotrichum tamarilloi]|uniref:Uncharacterized protein n=1 Tax=Colletotrichum tamarilloi TaxID=1209934 RepID=A0ABQ9QGJ1_9PEZI|nr:uncharacterized protein CTAM01_17181 [Colletotrichum tamarilloi]KAK1458300.1 hypothetical protein CTAM01_17181 [Colletotrichum tamarilloi]